MKSRQLKLRVIHYFINNGDNRVYRTKGENLQYRFPKDSFWRTESWLTGIDQKPPTIEEKITSLKANGFFEVSEQEARSFHQKILDDIAAQPVAYAGVAYASAPVAYYSSAPIDNTPVVAASKSVAGDDMVFYSKPKPFRDYDEPKAVKKEMSGAEFASYGKSRKSAMLEAISERAEKLKVTNETKPVSSVYRSLMGIAQDESIEKNKVGEVLFSIDTISENSEGKSVEL